MLNHAASFKKQSGMVLIVSLVILVMLTLIGLTGTQVTTLEEKMAFNSREHNLAFQAAEAALRAGENQIEAIAAIAAFDGSNGLLGEDDATYDFGAASTWTNDNSAEFDSGITMIATQPRYFIKYIATGDVNTGAKINLGGYGDSSSGGAVSYFTVTAKGTGGQDNSQVFLRSYYGKRF